MKSLRTSAFRTAALSLAVIFLFGSYGLAQEPATSAVSADAAVRDLQDQVRQLRTLVEEMREENAQSRAEMHQLRHDLETTRALLEKPGEAVAQATPASGSQIVPSATSASASSPASTSIEERVQKLEETASLLGSKVDEQYQTKVETASKYRARLHGIVLMNAFGNKGGANNFDFPDYSQPVGTGNPNITLGATLRQTEIGLEIFGPNVVGAKTSADVQMDFAGGFPGTGNGVNFGIVRLQTASMRFDWERTSVVAGQDSLFISPLSPTSFASLATPTFAFAGNLWGWTPQLRLEHRFALSNDQTITMQGGVFDNLDWEFPPNQFFRSAQAGELSGQPAYGFRTAWSRSVGTHPLSIGVAGYYGRQNWTWGRNVDAWAAMSDWQIPILPRLGLSGEFYRGRGIGGLGAAVGTSIVFGGKPSDPGSPIRAVDAAGGWAQLKFQLTPKVEVNGVFSQDNAFTGNTRGFAIDANNFGEIFGRNRGVLGNIVFRPRSDLLLSAEFRRLQTFPVYSISTVTDQAGLAVGILF